MGVAWEELRVRESPGTEVQHAAGYLGMELRRGEAGEDRHGQCPQIANRAWAELQRSLQ